MRLDHFPAFIAGLILGQVQDGTHSGRQHHAFYGADFLATGAGKATWLKDTGLFGRLGFHGIELITILWRPAKGIPTTWQRLRVVIHYTRGTGWEADDRKRLGRHHVRVVAAIPPPELLELDPLGEVAQTRPKNGAPPFTSGISLARFPSCDSLALRYRQGCR